MPIQVTCPSCHTTLKTADSSAGKRAKCPKCDGVLEIPIPVAEIVEDDEYELEAAAPAASNELGGTAPASEIDRRPCPACGEMIARKAIKCRFCNEIFDRSLRGIATGSNDVHHPGWQKVRGGLGMLYYAVTAIFAVLALSMVFGMVMGGTGAMDFKPGEDPPGGVLVLFMVIGLVMFVAGICAIVGQVRCASVPAESGAKGFASGAAICILLYVIGAVIGGAAELPVLTLLGAFASFIGSILFILFIRAAAAYLDAQDLSSSAGRFLAFTAISFILGIAMGVAAGAADAPALFGLLSLGVIICVLIGIIWYLRLIKGLMTTIDQATFGS
jgi:phage FluMu protein Com